MSVDCSRKPWIISMLALLMMVGLLLSPMACGLPYSKSGEDQKSWVPENPTQYTAEVQSVWEVFVPINAEGYVVDFESDAPFGATANMRYVLRFWDVGELVPGKGAATIYRVYTPTSISTIAQRENYTEAEVTEIYARTGFPNTEVKLHDLNFTGGPEGKFIGTNSETGNPIYGHMEWNEKLREMHAIFTEDINQDYLVIAEEPFYNWP